MVVHRGAALVLAGACATACLSVAACGSGNSDPLAGMSAKQVADKAVSNLKDAGSFTILGNTTQSDGTYNVNLGYRGQTACQGTISQTGRGSLSLVVMGTSAWIRPDAAFIKSVTGNQSSQVIKEIGGRYLKGSTNNANVAQVTKLCDVSTLTSPITQASDLAKQTVTTINGQRVLPIKDKAKGGTLFVTDTANPQVFLLQNTSANNTGRIQFKVGARVTVTAPPANQTVDGAQFGFCGLTTRAPISRQA